MQPVVAVTVRQPRPLIAPRYLKLEEELSDAALRTIVESREISDDCCHRSHHNQQK